MVHTRRSIRSGQPAACGDAMKQEDTSPPRTRRKRADPIKAEAVETPEKMVKIKKFKADPTPEPFSPSKAAASLKRSKKPVDLQARKLKSYTQYGAQTPFPTFPHPTAAECKLAHRILASLHGARGRPTRLVASASRAGCGDSPSVLDALVRTVLSQNTSDTNSSRAKRAMDAAYGRSDEWAAVVAGGQVKLEDTIRCGGLAAVKSRVILNILEQVRERYGTYSLEHLHGVDSARAMQELLSFKGVGPKTASCVLLFCLGRESFAVDTHVWRIAGLLGWRPKEATREETHLHLDVMIPDEDKYGLHILLVTHGKRCDECKAGGKSLGACELRRAFKKWIPVDSGQEGFPVEETGTGVAVKDEANDSAKEEQ